MNQLLTILYLLTLLGFLSYSYGQTISYSSRTYNGITKYYYNGREYSSLKEVMDAIRRQYPDVIFQPITPGGSGSSGSGGRPPSVPSGGRPSGSGSGGSIRPPYKPSGGRPGGSGYGGFDISKYKGNNPFSNKIFDDTWKKYKYDSDSRNSFKVMKKRFLIESNRYRVAHNAPKLVEDPGLAAKAQAYADYLASIEQLVHDPKNHEEGTGENLAYGSVPISHLAVKKWYDEIDLYNFNKPGFSSATGHFTQLVWRKSRKAGFGVAVSRDGKKVFVVCKYYPAGNDQREYPANVRPRVTTKPRNSPSSQYRRRS